MPSRVPRLYEKPLAPLSLGGVVEDAVKLYRASFNRAWVPALMLQVLLTGGLFFVRMQHPQLFDAQGMLLAMDQVDPTLLAFYLVAFAVSLIFSNAVTVQLLAVRGGGELSIGSSLVAGLRFFLPTLGLALLLSPVGVFGAIVAGAPGADPVRALLGVLYVLLTLYLVGRVFLAGVALLDGAGVLGAVRASWHITRNHWRRAVVGLLTMFVIFLMALFVLSVAAGVLNLVVQAGTMTGTLAVQLVSAVIQAVTVPLFYAGLVSIYFDLKLRSTRNVPGTVTGIP